MIDKFSNRDDWFEYPPEPAAVANTDFDTAVSFFVLSAGLWLGVRILWFFSDALDQGDKYK